MTDTRQERPAIRNRLVAPHWARSVMAAAGSLFITLAWERHTTSFLAVGIYWCLLALMTREVLSAAQGDR